MFHYLFQNQFHSRWTCQSNSSASLLFFQATAAHPLYKEAHLHNLSFSQTTAQDASFQRPFPCAPSISRCGPAHLPRRFHILGTNLQEPLFYIPILSPKTSGKRTDSTCNTLACES